MTSALPKRLIEVDLPIKRISAHARREKSIRHGHLSTLHIWWARRPLAACRAVICAALWPDPADPVCPESFRKTARLWMQRWVKNYLKSLGSESLERFVSYQNDPSKLENNEELRNALLDFIADFANWDNSNAKEFVDTSRALTQAAHEALGGTAGSKPLVVDPFAGGGSIPLEALRVGADVFASDLNPVAVLLDKVLLEYIPKYGHLLADQVRQHGERIKRTAEKELAAYYPNDLDGATPIAYLWARTIRCEGPNCGAVVPLVRSLWLARKGERAIALQVLANKVAKRIDFRIIMKRSRGWVDSTNEQDIVERPSFDGTVKRGSVTCPCCGYTTPVERVRDQLKGRRGGADDAQLLCVVTTRAGQQGRVYRLPTDTDLETVKQAALELENRSKRHVGQLSLVPDECISLNEIRRISLPLYGMSTWGDVFSARQKLALTTLVRLVAELATTKDAQSDEVPCVVIATTLALVVDRIADSLSTSVTWTPGGEFQGHTFTRQALAFVSDFAEVNPWCDSSGNWMGAIEWVSKVCESVPEVSIGGQVVKATATAIPLPDDSVDAVITDPPYYDAVPYSHLSDFFYVWLHRSIGNQHPTLFDDSVVSKGEEIVVDRPHELSNSTHDIAYYERELTKAFAEGRRILGSNGVATIVFASKTTASWEAILKAVVEAGWTITASWPIDTEREARIAAQGQARLASSVHLVCRPRESGTDRGPERIGDWRDVLHVLPMRMHQWMPRLAEEGVVGADAIFACLGPALEVFSQYSRVEKASGQIVELTEYLEQVWAAVAKEALATVFKGADASGFEEDARLTAIWLWTLFADQSTNNGTMIDDSEESEERGDASGAPKGFILEYDAARKIAQGLGAHLESLASLVEVKGETARLLPVAERTRSLFGKEEDESPTRTRKKKTSQLQLGFVAELEQAEETGGWSGKGVPAHGATVLDRIHQCMILFAAGRGEALRRFLIDEGVGRDERFWRLSQVLSYLYPKASDEKRWIDGVLARKKGLGF
jgi:putative DNA methylase